MLALVGAASVQGLTYAWPKTPAVPAAAWQIATIEAPAMPPSLASMASASVSPPATGSIEIDHGEIRIGIAAMPLIEAARQLAGATHATLQGSEVLRGPTSRVTLEWQGHSVTTAWQQLLEAEASSAAKCDERGCGVWVLGSLATRAIEPPSITTAVVQPPLDKGVTPTPISPIPRPLPAAPQPDPPGLFPSDG